VKLFFLLRRIKREIDWRWGRIFRLILDSFGVHGGRVEGGVLEAGFVETLRGGILMSFFRGVLKGLRQLAVCLLVVVRVSEDGGDRSFCLLVLVSTVVLIVIFVIMGITRE
jgi:hypothetical protein